MGMWRERDVRTLLSIHRLEESPFLRYTLHYTQGLKEAKGEMVGLERNMPFSHFPSPSWNSEKEAFKILRGKKSFGIRKSLIRSR